MSGVSLACDICGTTFKHRSSKSRHKKVCISRTTRNNSLDLEKQVKLLQQTVDELKAQIVSQQPNITNIVANVQILVIKNFRYEDKSYITPAEIKKLVKHKKHSNALSELVIKTHFNQLHPENMNVFVNEQNILLFVKSVWSPYTFEDAAWLLIINISEFMTEYVENANRDELEDHEKDHYLRWYENLKQYNAPIDLMIETVQKYQHIVADTLLRFDKLPRITC